MKTRSGWGAASYVLAALIAVTATVRFAYYAAYPLMGREPGGHRLDSILLPLEPFATRAWLVMAVLTGLAVGVILARAVHSAGGPAGIEWVFLVPPLLVAVVMSPAWLFIHVFDLLSLAAAAGGVVAARLDAADRARQPRAPE